MKFPDYQVIFEGDYGSFRDVYVMNASLNDWQKLVDFLRAGLYRTEFFFGDQKQEKLPERAIDLFNDSERTSCLIKVHIGDLALHCHCFSKDEIEFDLVPEKVTNQAIANSVFLFMEKLSKYLGMPVRLTPENSRDIILVEYNSDGVISAVWNA